MAKRKEATAPTQPRVPRVLGDFPNWLAATQKLTDLHGLLRKNETAIHAAEQQRQPAGRGAAVENAAQVLLGGTATATEPVVDVLELQIKRDGAIQAIQIQKAVVAKELATAGQAIRGDLAAEHDQIRADIIRLVIDLNAAWTRDRSMIAGLQAMGISRGSLRLPNFAQSPQLPRAIESTNITKFIRDNQPQK